MIHINTVPLTKDGNHIDYWAKFELVDEKVECVFVKDGEEFQKIHNIIVNFGVLGTIAYLMNNGNAEKEVMRIIEKSNKSTHSRLKGLSIIGGGYHDKR